MILEVVGDDVSDMQVIPIRDVQAYIDLIKEHGYEDINGRKCSFDHARVEFDKMVIYVDIVEEE